MSSYPILRAIERANQAVSRRLTDGTLTDVEAQVLFHLDHLPAGSQATVGELRSAFGFPATTLTSVLDRLESRGLVARAINPADRRSFLVVPTPAGRKRMAAISKQLIEIENRIAEAVSPVDLDAFRRVLEALEEAIG